MLALARNQPLRVSHQCLACRHRPDACVLQLVQELCGLRCSGMYLHAKSATDGFGQQGGTSSAWLASSRHPCLDDPTHGFMLTCRQWWVRTHPTHPGYRLGTAPHPPNSTSRLGPTPQGWPLLLACDAVEPGCVQWRRAFSPPYAGRRVPRKLMAVENGNQVGRPVGRQ
jgi:hypothetical protein